MVKILFQLRMYSAYEVRTNNKRRTLESSEKQARAMGGGWGLYLSIRIGPSSVNPPPGMQSPPPSAHSHSHPSPFSSIHSRRVNKTATGVLVPISYLVLPPLRHLVCHLACRIDYYWSSSLGTWHVCLQYGILAECRG